MKSAALGILLLAHGGDPSWNKEVETLRARVDAKTPTETSLGMADVKSLQAAVDRLEKRGVTRIVAVPLFVQTRSEVLDQTRYALGLAKEPFRGSLGTKPTNHWLNGSLPLLSRVPNSAVPDLPAMRIGMSTRL